MALSLEERLRQGRNPRASELGGNSRVSGGLRGKSLVLAGCLQIGSRVVDYRDIKGMSTDRVSRDWWVLGWRATLRWEPLAVSTKRLFPSFRRIECGYLG